MRKYFQHLLWVSFTVFMLLQSAGAVEVAALDQASVPVNSRSVVERNKALRQALADVIVKNAGDPQVLNNPIIAEQLNDPSIYLTQYGYDDQAGRLAIRGQFDQRRITDLLHQAQVPVWGKQRPLVLFWLSTQKNNQRVLVGDTVSSSLRRSFREDADAKGLPVIFPLMDLDDLMKVSEADVRGNFPDAVFPASGRYQADYFVLATLEQQPNSQFSYRMDLYPMQHTGSLWQPLFETERTLPTRHQAINSMVSSLSQYFVSQYAVSDTGSDEKIKLSFLGIKNQNQLVALEKYIKQLDVAKSATIAQIQGNKVTFTLDLFGNKADLQRQLNLDPRLTPVDNIQAEPEAFGQLPLQVPKTLEYYWR